MNKTMGGIASFGVWVLVLAGTLLMTRCGPSDSVSIENSPSRTTPVKTRQLRFQTFMRRGQVFTESFQETAGKMIKELTHGEIEIRYIPDGRLLPAEQVVAGVQAGMVDLVHTSPSRDAGKIGPAGNIVLGMPFMWKDINEARTLFHHLGIGEIVRSLYAPFNIHVVGPVNGTGNNIGFVSKVPIRTLADFKGLKLRISGGRPAADLFSAFGSIPVGMGMGEIYSSIATGVIDGASFNSVEAYLNQGFYEIAKYIIKPAYMRNYSTLLIANKTMWDSLTSRQQRIIELSFNHWYDRSYELVNLADSEALIELQAKGMEVITLPEEDVRQLIKEAEKTWDAVAGEDPTANKALKIIKDYLRSLGYIES